MFDDGQNTWVKYVVVLEFLIEILSNNPSVKGLCWVISLVVTGNSHSYNDQVNKYNTIEKTEEDH